MNHAPIRFSADLIFILFVRSSRKHKQNKVQKKKYNNCDQHRNVATLTKVSKLGKNFVEVDRIWRLYEAPSKRRQMITTAYEVG